MEPNHTLKIERGVQMRKEIWDPSKTLS